MKTFEFVQGNQPLLISMPHNGQEIPDEIAEHMTAHARRIPDTDWYMDRLYSFAADMGLNIVKPYFSRYVIDLNRPPDGAILYPSASNTELCPTSCFDGSSVYARGHEPDDTEIQRRKNAYWDPYHQQIQRTLDSMLKQFGVAVVFDAHSIRSHVSRFFAGQLPDFNFGTADGQSCGQDLRDRLAGLNLDPYTRVIDGRFKGGFITRRYGQPEKSVHAVQLELSQATYLNEEDSTYLPERAEKLIPFLKTTISTIIEWVETQADDSLSEAS